MQIFGGWFKHNNWSITLKEPLSSKFDDDFELFNENEENIQELFENEFKLFLTSSILASDSFIDFERFDKLISKSTLNNVDLLAIYDTHYKTLMRYLPKSYRKNDILRKIEKKLNRKIQNTHDFEDRVNKPLKLIEKK
jgi:hypothetical protein